MNNLVAGFVSGWLVFAVVLVLHLVLPARKLAGYARHEKSGEPLSYRLNGLRVFALCLALWFALGYTGVLPWDWFWRHRWAGAAGACVLGLTIAGWVVFSAPGRGNSLPAEYYLGRRVNPQMFNGRADAKMYLYLAGATLLQLNLLSFAAHHHMNNPGDLSPGVVLYVLLFTWFICDYLFFERVHLYTYDLFAERLGFKLIWGCLVWYPYFYAVGLWAVAERPNPNAPLWLYVFAALLFLIGWVLARGANMQKFAFKRNPKRPFLGLVAQRAITDGERRVLCSGFWGVSRHVNYLGELLMASGLALSLGWPLALGPWLYPLYYVLLLVPRERDDDRRCAEKYGALWEEYRKRVPWRIIPRIY